MNNVKIKKSAFNALKILLCAVIIFSSVFSLGFDKTKAAFDEGINFRVGLVFGSSVKKVLPITSTATYDVGFQSLTDSSKSYENKTSFPAGTIYVAADGYNTEGVAFGGYNVQCKTSFSNYASASAAANEIRNAIDSYYNVFVAYINNAYRVRVGNFTSSGVSIAMNYVAPKANKYSFEASYPGEKTLTVYNSGGTILIEFESDTLALGVKAQSGFISYNSKTYDGVMAFSRYLTSSRDGVQLVNVLPIERYVMCIIPNEVYVSWPSETLKAFAITVRSYALSHLNGYSSYGFDLNSTAQVYGNANKIESRTEAAVRDTAGLVIAYNGRVAEAMYSSSVGGVTVGSGDAFVTDYGYLKPVYTPWEHYAEFSNGLWIVEATGETLFQSVKGYATNLTGTKIVDIKINSYGTNSTYVKSITVTDDNGKTATITGSDKIRNAFGVKDSVRETKVRSANFVVGKGSVSYTYDKVIKSSANAYDGDYPAFNLTDFKVITSVGELFSRFTKNLKIRTKDGTVTYSSPKSNVITGENTSNGHIVYTTESASASVSTSSGKFIFVGKGNGHGVGLSQYGIRDLGNLGYTYEEMLHAYYTDVTIVNYSTVGIN